MQAWESLSEAATRISRKKHGEIAARVARNLKKAESEPLAAQLSASWFLSKKHFRKLLPKILPDGHYPEEILSPKNALATPAAAQKTARFYARLRQAGPALPSLPEGTPRSLVWLSPVARPAELSLTGFLVAKIAEPDQLQDTLAQLWASLAFRRVIQRLPYGLKGIEVCAGVIPLLPEGDPEEALLSRQLAQLFSEQTQERVRLYPPFASRPIQRPLVELDLDLIASEEPAITAALASFGEPALRGLLGRKQGRPGVVPAVALMAASQYRKSWDRGSFEAFFLDSSLTHLRRAPAQLSEIPGLLLKVRQLLSRLDELESPLQKLEEKRHQLAAWMKEFDFALLPDDALRKSLEDAQEERVSLLQLYAELAFTLEQLSQIYLTLSQESRFELEAGVELPHQKVLADWQGAMSACATTAWEDPFSEELPRPLQKVLQDSPGYLPAGAGPSSFVLASFQRGPKERITVAEMIRSARVRADRSRHQRPGPPQILAGQLSQLRHRIRAGLAQREQIVSHQLMHDCYLRNLLASVEERLRRLEPDLLPGSSVFVTYQELILAIDLRGRGLADRSSWRRAEYLENLAPHSKKRAGGSSAEQAASGLRGLASFNSLERIFELDDPRRSVHYGGRTTDSFALLCRSLGVEILQAEKE